MHVVFLLKLCTSEKESFSVCRRVFHALNVEAREKVCVDINVTIVLESALFMYHINVHVFCHHYRILQLIH